MKIMFLIFLISCFTIAQEDQVIKMGYRTTEKLPYIGEEPDDSGYFQDLYSEVARRIGCKLEIVRLPKKRVLESLKDGDIDFYPGFSFSDERAEYSYWISTGRKQRDIAISLEDLHDLKEEKDLLGLIQLVALGNPDYLSEFDRTRFIQNVVPEMDLERAVLLLNLKRADFYIYEEDAVKYFIKIKNIKNLKLHTELIAKFDFESAGFSRRSKIFEAVPNLFYDSSKPLSRLNLPENPKVGSIVYRFEKEINKMILEGEVTRIYKKYFE
ncbi:MAG: transporter substrate-binding domain-containing protein [Candidatus Delongbacteria bacterium]|nr:transporter substrate-binding domain-containing protein [Candidatus Delongbacteria bacterium]MBN2836687.1 transporter substrate-binding domain-containing protein [Candidatus Delongbacteria bacterium]